MTDYRSVLGERWHNGTGTITYSFLGSIPAYYQRVDTDGDGSKDSIEITEVDLLPIGAKGAMSATEKGFAQRAVTAWNEVANVHLVAGTIPGSAVGDIIFGAGTFADEDTFGFVADFPGALRSPSPHGDVWINRGNSLQAASKLGTTGWQTYLHELGHALGLHHPDEDPDNEAGDPRNNNQYTVMSYIAHPGQQSAPDETAAWPLTPMMFDIKAAQTLYGPNLSTRSGATTYFGPAPAGTTAHQPLLDGGKISNGFTAILTIWDAGGNDTISAQNQTRAVTINLNPGTFSTIGAIPNNIGLAMAVTVDGVIVNLIENAIGGAGADKLIGNGGANSLNGRGGADTMTGGGGNDSYVVDNVGDKMVETSTGGTADKVSSSVSYVLGGYVEQLALTGTAAINGTGNGRLNTLTGNAGANILDGKLGADTLRGGAGNDTYIVDNVGDVVTEVASAGVDTIRASVTETLAAYVEKLVLTGTGAINGTGNGQANAITGNGGANILNGGAGKDVLTGGAGADRFQFDTALSATTNWDDVLDFSVAADTIVLDRTIFSKILVSGTLASTAFVSGTSAKDGGDRIIYDKGTGNIFYDADGSGAAAKILFAQVNAGTSLTNADFYAVA